MEASSRKSNVPIVENKRQDGSLEEFLEVMQSKPKKVVSWMNHVDPPEKDKALATQGGLQGLPEEDQQDLTDMEWMRQRMREGIRDGDSLKKGLEQSDSREQDQEGSEEKDPTQQTILRTARLFVRNLTFTCTEEELGRLFQPYGAVSQVRTNLLRWNECWASGER